MEFPPHYAIFSPYIRAIKYIIIRRVETMSEYQFTYSIWYALKQQHLTKFKKGVLVSKEFCQ